MNVNVTELAEAVRWVQENDWQGGKTNYCDHHCAGWCSDTCSERTAARVLIRIAEARGM